jgi:hypothetical protein
MTDFESNLARPAFSTGFDPVSVGERLTSDFRETASRLGGALPSGKAHYERYPLGCDCIRYELGEAESAAEQWVAAVGAEPSRTGVRRATGQLINMLGSRHARLVGRLHWINKTPEIVRFGLELELCVGPCRRVLLIRNGYDVVASARYLQWASVQELARWWRLLVELSREHSPPGRYLEVRYEDLVTDPAHELQRILDFLCLDGSGQVLLEDYGRHAGGSMLGRPSQRPQRALPDSDREIVEAEAGDLLAQLGYR